LLLERSAQLVAMAETTLHDLQAHGALPRGRLRISAPHGLIAGWLSNVIAEFIKRYPDVCISLVFTNHAVDLIAEGIDIHLTGGRIDDMNQHDRIIGFHAAVHRHLILPTRGLEGQMRDGHGREAQHLTTAQVFRRLRNAALGPVGGGGADHHVELRQPPNASWRGAVLAWPTCPSRWHSRIWSAARWVPVLREHMRSDHYAACLQRRHNSAAMRAMLDFLEQSTDSAGGLPQ
jgi:DNA-binding transcriptional LysR family regulator